MRKFGNILWGLVFIAVGLILGLNATGITDINLFFDGWWTIFIIVPCFIGLFRDRDKIGNLIGLLIGNANKKGKNEYCATFSGQNINFNGQEFQGVDLTAVFGGVKCDLRNAKITSDQVINANTTFGGIEVFVPNNVQVRIKATPIFGGVTDKSVHTTNSDAPIIYINATCVFGGVEIK